MRIFCLIDSLGSGGAQRQLVTMAVGLKKRGHLIRFLVYHKNDHFLPLLQAEDIYCQIIQPCSYVQRVLAIRQILREGWQDVVLAFLEAPSFYAELACIPTKRWGLVVGERLADPSMRRGIGLWLRQFHRLADAVVCNSYTNQLMLEALFPFLKKKMFTVYNTVDLTLFHSVSDETINNENICERGFRIVIAAGYHEKKNMINVAKALLILKNKKIPLPIVVDWFGAMQADQVPYKKVQQFIAENELENIFRLHDTTRDIAIEYCNADAIGLFSFYEGLPNVVCEGMASGKPILLSNVCDAGNLVEDGKNGFLCDPSSPEDIADKIIIMFTLSELQRRQMGLESRRMAELLFAESVVIDRYEHILKLAADHFLLPVDCSCPSEVPESALWTVQHWVNGN